MSLTSASAGEVPMGPSHEDATVAVQSSLMDVGISNVRVANVLMSAGHDTSDGVITTSPPSDVVVLYHTLVQDGALPSGYESEFAALEPYIFPEAERQLRQLARLDNVSASIALHHFGKERAQMEQVEKKATEQFLAAALNKPKVYKTRLQKSFYETSTARRDTEEAERVRWVSELCTLLRGTPTPMGKLLVDKPSSESLVGAGKRAATLRSRVRMARRYLAWLSVNYKVTFPNCVEHLTEFLKVRVSEPCNRGPFVMLTAALDFSMKLPESHQKTQSQETLCILSFFMRCCQRRSQVNHRNRHLVCQWPLSWH